MAEIIPAIIPENFRDLEEKLTFVKGAAQSVHIDVTDGTLGGKVSWPLVGDTGEFKKMKEQERGMPFWEDFDFEFHLMTSEPLSHARDYIDAGATRIIFQVESLDYENDIQFLDQLKTSGVVEIGISIKADTEATELAPFFQIADFIQVMTIDRIGAQGAKFDQRGLEHLQWVKENYHHIPISVDGSMNLETAEAALNLGADRIVAGSFIFGAVNPREALEELKNLV